jgi:predicted transport protein
LGIDWQGKKVMAPKTLAQKLFIRPGYTVALLDAPKEVAELLAPLPEDVKVVSHLKQKPDLVLQFVKTSSELEKAAKALKNSLDENVVLWFAYPKQSSKVASDLTRDQGWQPIYAMGFEGVASVAIDDTWSGIRFKLGLPKGEEDLVAKQYAGDRAALLPLYEKVVAIAKKLGPDVELSPRQSYVAFSRGKQFALVRPTRDRLDLVLKLPNAPLSARLQAAAGMGSGSMTHRVIISEEADIDREVIKWLQDAYHSVSS